MSIALFMGRTIRGNVMHLITKLMMGIVLILAATSTAHATSHAKTKNHAFHGKALFNYPNPHPVYIVTFTQEELERMKMERTMQSLSRANYVKKAKHQAVPELN